MFKRLKRKAWWNGYYRGIAESSELWATIVSDELSGQHTPLRESILAQCTRELGIICESGIAKARRLDNRDG